MYKLGISMLVPELNLEMNAREVCVLGLPVVVL